MKRLVWRVLFYQSNILSMRRLNYTYMVLAALCLGTIGVLVKLIGDTIPIMTLNFFRIFFGLLFLLAVVPFLDKKWYKITKKDAKDFFLIGSIYAISLSLYTAANIFTSIQNAVLLNYSYPFFVLVFGYFLLKEKITLTKIITLIIAAAGLLIINPFQFGESNLGNMLALTGAVFYGLLIVNMRKEGKTHGIGAVVWFFLFASILLSPFPFIYGLGEISSSIVYLVILGIVSTALAHLFYNLALKRIEAETGSLIAIMITPILSIVLASVVIGEQIMPETIMGGGLLMLAGICLESHNRKLRKEKERIIDIFKEGFEKIDEKLPDLP